MPASYRVSQRLRRLRWNCQAETVGFLMGLQTMRGARCNGGISERPIDSRVTRHSLARGNRRRFGRLVGNGACAVNAEVRRTRQSEDPARGDGSGSQSLGDADFAILAEFALAQVYLEQEQFDAAEQFLARVEWDDPLRGVVTLSTSRNRTRNSPIRREKRQTPSA